MARPLRILTPNAWHHVVNRGNRRERIFRTDDDRRRFLGCLSEFPVRFRIEVHAFVLMDNHYHLLLRPSEKNLSRAIQWLQLSYSVRFNWAHEISGHLFQGRFKGVVIQKDEDVAEAVRYLHLNPVRVAALGLGKPDRARAKVAAIEDPGADLVARRLKALETYPWSSWQVYGGKETAPKWLETGFIRRANGGRSVKEQSAALRAYTEAPLRQGRLDDPWDRVIGGAVLGDADHAKRLFAEAKADVRVNAQEQTEARKLSRVGRVPWETLVKWAEEEAEVKWEEALQQYGDWTRDAVLYLAVRYAGYGLSEVYGRIPGLKYQAGAQGVRRIERRRAEDPACERFLRRLVAKM
jgi:putative transposase